MIPPLTHNPIPKPEATETAPHVSSRGKFLNGLFTDNWHFNVFYVLLLIAAVSLLFAKSLMWFIVIPMLLNWFMEWNWKEKRQILCRQWNLPVLVISILYFFVTIVGFFYSANKAAAWSDFEYKLWFLVAPTVLLTVPRQYLTRERIGKVFLVFAAATVVHIIILFVVATFRTLKYGQSFFFYYVFSIFMHPSYVSMYAVTSFFLILYFFTQQCQTLSLTCKIVLCGCLLVLAAGIFCLGSKAGLIVFCLLGLIWFFYLFNCRKKKIGWSILICIGFIAAGIFLYGTNLPPVARFKQSFMEIEQYRGKTCVDGSTGVRLTVWKSAWEISKKNLPWGVGIGDSRDELCYNSVKNNYTNLVGHSYNTHNQYLQSLLTLGIPGVIALLLYCLMPVVVSIRRKDILYFSFSIVIILNMLVESMFERHSGVDFIALFNMLFYIF